MAVCVNQHSQSKERISPTGFDHHLGISLKAPRSEGDPVMPSDFLQQEWQGDNYRTLQLVFSVRRQS